ncbi:MAG: hypothetical protein JWN75_315 [Candidatus Saccharibacteria bacterium]|nr:hypothetical protein [Candidatus Saccharibacteria bacterium]
MDIVYLIKTDSENDSEELRYSLRSLQNLPHGKVFMVGEKPDWATNVTFIPVEQSKTKSENWAMNLRAAVASSDISDEFVMMNDDFFIMKPIPEIPRTNFGSMKDIIDQYEQRYPEGSHYITSMKKLYASLQEKGISNPLSYELHTPMVLSKSKMTQMYQKQPGPYYQLRSFYGNIFNLGGESVPDVKIFIEPRHNSELYTIDPRSYLEQQVFLSSTGGSFKRGFAGTFVREHFSEKSVYEL